MEGRGACLKGRSEFRYLIDRLTDWHQEFNYSECQIYDQNRDCLSQNNNSNINANSKTQKNNFFFSFLLFCPLVYCNGPRVVQRKDRQKKEFHDQSDYRQWCMLLMSSTNLSSHTGRHNKQFFSQCSGERQNIFEKLQYHPAPHTPNGNIHPHISSFIHYSFR